MTRAAVTLSASLFVFSSMSWSCLSPIFGVSCTIFFWSSTQTIESSRFSFTASSCPMFPVTFCHVLRKEGKHEENKSGETEKTKGDDDKHSPADVPRAVCVTHKSLNHKKHTIAAKPSQKSSAKAFSMVDSGPSTQTFGHAEKHANKRPPFQTLLTILTIGFTHFSWWRVLSSAIRSPWQNHEERKKDRKHENKTRKWKEEKWIFCHENFDFGEKSKQRSQKSVRKIGKRTKGQRKTLTEHFFLQWGFPKKKRKAEKKGERWLDATDVPRPGSMTTECTQTWLTRLRHDTQQWSRGPSFAHAILNTCESCNIFSFKRDFFFEKEKSEW